MSSSLSDISPPHVEQYAQCGGAVVCNERFCCAAADLKSPRFTLKWPKMLCWAYICAVCYLLLRQAGRNRSILLPYRLSRLRKGQNITRITWFWGLCIRGVFGVFEAVGSCTFVISAVHLWPSAVNLWFLQYICDSCSTLCVSARKSAELAPILRNPLLISLLAERTFRCLIRRFRLHRG